MERKKLVSDQLQAAYAQNEKLEPPDEHEIENRIVTFRNVLDSFLDDSIPAHNKNQFIKGIIKDIYYAYNNGTVELDIHFK